MATCVVSGTLIDSSETAVSGAEIVASVITPQFSSTSLIVPKEVTTTSASNGTFSISLSQGASIVLTIKYPPNSIDSLKQLVYNITIPASASANISTLITEF